jgi:hypothetical protein
MPIASPLPTCAPLGAARLASSPRGRSSWAARDRTTASVGSASRSGQEARRRNW